MCRRGCHVYRDAHVGFLPAWATASPRSMSETTSEIITERLPSRARFYTTRAAHEHSFYLDAVFEGPGARSIRKKTNQNCLTGAYIREVPVLEIIQ